MYQERVEKASQMNKGHLHGGERLADIIARASLCSFNV